MGMLFFLGGMIGVNAQPSQKKPLQILSDTTWLKSTVVKPSSYSGQWDGHTGKLPAKKTFSIPTELGQPYGYPSINPVGQAGVVKTTNQITFFRKEFSIEKTEGRELTIRATVDDQMEIYINAERLARIGSFGPTSFKNPSHNVKFTSGKRPENAFDDGDAYDFLLTKKLDGILKKGRNEIILVIRNQAKPDDLGGFSLQMDFDEEEVSTPKDTARSEIPVVNLNVLKLPDSVALPPPGLQSALFMMEKTPEIPDTFPLEIPTDTVDLAIADTIEDPPRRPRIPSMPIPPPDSALVRGPIELQDKYILKIFPNPAVSHVNIYVSGAEFEAELISKEQGILRKAASQNGASISFDVDELDPGRYIVRALVAGQVLTQGLTVE